MKANRYLEVHLSGNLNVSTLTPFALAEIMDGYLKNNVKELKRLQKEIDDSEEERTEIIMSSWGLDNPNNNERNFELIDLITENQLKIKQIIESL